MKVLNLYAGIGGNRKLWEDVEVTAVELDPQIAEIYKSYFPNDNVIVGDAHQYLLDHYKEYDFIWASPPCPTHSRMNKIQVSAKQIKPRYADMKLYQEVIFLAEFYEGKYCVENVIPYYEPLIPAQKNGRHLYWCNFKIQTTGGGNPEKKVHIALSKNHAKKLKTAKEYGQSIRNIKTSKSHFGFSINGLKISNQRRDKVLRNCVDPEKALMILNCARNIITKSNVKQIDLFE
jgi:DNA (cytosine-5)-methyltransferase 1